MHNIFIRPATEADAQHMAQVHIASWQAAYRGILSDQFLDGMRLEDWTNMWQLGIETVPENDQDNWVAEVQGDIVAFAVVGPAEDESRDEVRELRLLYVTPDQWRKGAARDLLQHVADDLRSRGFKEMMLWVIETNTRARRFYERMGWQKASGSKPFFIEDVPQVSYRLTLS